MADGPKLGLRVTKRLLERLVGVQPGGGRADRSAAAAAAAAAGSAAAARPREEEEDGQEGVARESTSGAGAAGEGHAVRVAGGERGSYADSDEIKRALEQSVGVGAAHESAPARQTEGVAGSAW